MRSTAHNSELVVGKEHGALPTLINDDDMVRLLPDLLTSKILYDIAEFTLEQTLARGLDLCRQATASRVLSPSRDRAKFQVRASTSIERLPRPRC